jgi:hypothetical protein
MGAIVATNNGGSESEVVVSWSCFEDGTIWGRDFGKVEY